MQNKPLNEELSVALGGKTIDGEFVPEEVSIIPESADEYAGLKKLAGNIKPGGVPDDTVFKDGPEMNASKSIEGTIFADTPKIIVIGTSGKEIMAAVAQIKHLYNGREQMPVILVDHEKRPIQESSIAELENYHFKEVLNDFIKEVAVEHMKQYDQEKYDMMKIRRAGNLGQSFDFKAAKKKRKLQKQSRKQNRRKR